MKNKFIVNINKIKYTHIKKARSANKNFSHIKKARSANKNFSHIKKSQAHSRLRLFINIKKCKFLLCQ